MTDTSEPATSLPPYGELTALREAVVRDGDRRFERWRPRITRRAFEPSALNLARYIALRRHELRHLQESLMPWGLSSLGRCEARVVENLDAVIATAAVLASPGDASLPRPSAEEFFRGHELLRFHAEAVLGPTTATRDVRIMVTLPLQAASDYPLVRDLVAGEMDVARINCAHDDADAWAAMAEHVRRAGRETGRPCRICMDISGPPAGPGASPPPLSTGASTSETSC